MVGILEDDWRDRKRLAESLNVVMKAEGRNEVDNGAEGGEEEEEEEEGPVKQAKEEIFSDSLVVRWLPDGRNRNSGGECRRVLRAVFADGGDEAMREFQEVWAGETRERQSKRAPGESGGSHSMKRKREAGNVNIEKDAFGDYCDVDEDDDDRDISEENRPPSSPQILSRSTPNVKASGSDAERLGGTPVLQLRARLLALVSSLDQTKPSPLTRHQLSSPPWPTPPQLFSSPYQPSTTYSPLHYSPSQPHISL